MYGTGHTGQVRYQRIESDGRISFDSGWLKNLTVNGSRGVAVDIYMNDLDAETSASIAIGTGNTTPSVSQTALDAQVLTGAGTVEADADGISLLISATLSGAWTGTFAEAGLFFGGTMVARTLVSGSKVSAGQVISFTWKITFTV